MSSEETNLKQVTVEVPEERLAEFHMFFGRFLAGRSGRRGRHGHRGHGHRRCREQEQAQAQAPTTDVAEV